MLKFFKIYYYKKNFVDSSLSPSLNIALYAMFWLSNGYDDIVNTNELVRLTNIFEMDEEIEKTKDGEDFDKKIIFPLKKEGLIDVPKGELESISLVLTQKSIDLIDLKYGYIEI